MCDNIIVEVDYTEPAGPCPPAAGFAGLVARTEEKARFEAGSLRCPIECEGSYVETIFKEWYCEAGIPIVTVQVRRLCAVV
jgi:hypothetical protein